MAHAKFITLSSDKSTCRPPSAQLARLKSRMVKVLDENTNEPVSPDPIPAEPEAGTSKAA